MKKLICLSLCLMLLCTFSLTAYAHNLPLVVDDAGILTTAEERALEEKALELQRQFGIDALILTVDSLDGHSAMSYAEDYYDYCGYGTDSQRSGTVFLLAMEEREWYFDTSGNAIYALTDYALMEQDELVFPYLRSGDYYGAFETWLDSLDHYFNAYENGAPIDGYIEPEDRYQGHDDQVYYEETGSVNWLISIAVGLGAGALTVGILSGMMNSKRPQKSAVEYLSDNDFHLNVRRDVFLYSQVSKTRRQNNSGSGSGRSGGSGVHRSSSGRTHGGRGGKF